MRCFLFLTGLSFALIASAAEPRPLFPKEGVPEGWRVSDWSDVSKPAPEDARWLVKDGVLHGSTPRGTWLISEREYGDFILAYEVKLGDQGNSGCGLRFPAAGDPAFDGLEMQMCDPRYYGDYRPAPWELTGALYKALAPKSPEYRAEDWNQIKITCKGPQVTIELNGKIILDTNLDEHTRQLERGAPLKERPRKGHIGFQELSRGGGHVQIRGATITELE